MADINIFPPARGLKTSAVQYGTQNPLNGGALRMNGWIFKSGTLTLSEGFTFTPGQTITAPNPFTPGTDEYSLVFTVKRFNVWNEPVYIVGRHLRTFDTGTASEVTVVNNMLSVSTVVKNSVVSFRDRYLIATFNTNDGLWWYDAQTQTARKAGVIAPVLAPSGAVGSATGLTGTYKGAYTYVNDQGHESSLSPVSFGVTVTNQKIDWSGITVGPTGTVKRNFYRTIAGGSILLFHSTINDNTTTTITGDNVADLALGVQGPSDHTVPVSNIRYIFASPSRVYLVDQTNSTLWASKVDEDTGAPNWEAYPESLSIVLPVVSEDKLQMGLEYQGDIYVGSRRKFFRIVGDIGLEPVVDKALDMGIIDAHAWCMTPEGMVFANEVGKVYLWNFSEMPVYISGDVDNQVERGIQAGATVNGGIAFTYNPTTRQVIINYDVTNKMSAVWDTNTRQWSTVPWGFTLLHYSDLFNLMFGTRTANSVLFKEMQTVEPASIDPTPYRFMGTAYPLQDYWTQQIYPGNGSDFYFSKIRITLRAVPIMSNIPPTLKIQWALDSGHRFESFYVDMTENYMLDANVGTGDSVLTVRTVDVPIHKVGKSIQVMISTVNNVASLNNGVEVYRIWIDGEELEQMSKDSDKRALEDGKLGY